MRYKIYDSEGKTEKSEVKELEYNGIFKGERYITAKVESPYPVDFKIGDRLTYHGEIFTLRDISSIKRNARNYQSGKSIEYDGLRFLGTTSDLYDIQFCDYVLNDNNLPYTGLGTFSFYVSKAEDFGSRIQANLDLNYGEGEWHVEYGNAKDIKKAKTMSISADTNLYDALIQFSNDYDINFAIKGYTITIGFTQESTEYEYFYGKGHGLTSLEVTTDSNQRIITRLKAYGSQRNIPYLYHANFGKEYVLKATSSQEAPGKENTLIITVDLGMDYDENDSVFTDRVNTGSQTGWYDFRISLRVDETEVYGMIECNGSGSLQPQNEAKIYVGPEYYESDTNAIQQLISYFNSVGAYPVNVYITKGYDITKVPSGNINVPSGMPNNMSVRNLMLPGFPSESLYDWVMRVSKESTETGRKVLALINEGFKFSENQYFPYIISPNADTYGIKDGEVTFDGSDEDWDEVYPSLEGMTTSELSTIAGYEGSDTFEDSGEVDRMLSDSDIKDNGVSSDGTYGDGSKDTEGTLMYASFEMTIPNIGFNLWDYKADGESPVIHMQDGMCAGRSFEILRCIPVDADDITKGYRLNLQREIDRNVNMYYPNRIYNISAGDEFVLEGIEMPDVYVEAASARLFFQSIEKLRDIDYLEKTYKPEIDNIFMARNPKYTENLYEGIKMCIADNDLGIVAITVSQLNIKEADGQIPKYEVTLEDESSAELLSLSTATGSTSGGQGAVRNIKLIRTGDSTAPTDRNAFSVLRSIEEFLSKKNDDHAKGKITFDAGAEFGEFIKGLYAGKGGAVDKDGNAEFESLRVRSYLQVMELIVNRLSALEGDRILTEADTIESVEVLGNGLYRLHLQEKWDGYFTAQAKNNVLKGIINTLAEGSGEYYTSWMRVNEVDTAQNTIDVILYPDEETPANRNFPPCAMMKIARWGNQTDEMRQSCLYLSSTEGRIVKLVGVTKPIIDKTNYGACLGTVPEFLNSLDLPLREGRDYMYVPGIITTDMIRIDYQGKPIVEYVDRGTWSADETYYHEDLNPETGIYETSDVWHNNGKWRCQKTGTKTEPSELTTDWALLQSAAATTSYEIVLTTAYYNVDKASKVSAKIEGYAYKVTGSSRESMESVNIKIGYSEGASTSVTTDGNGFFTDNGWFAGHIFTDSETANQSASIYATYMNGDNAAASQYVSVAKDGLDGLDGAGNITADLDNEMTSVVCDNEGNVTAGIPTSTKVSMYYSTEKLTLENLSVGSVTGVTASADKGTGKVTVSSVTRDAANVTNLPITCSARYNGQLYERTLYFKISKIKQGENGEDAVIYGLSVSPTAVKVNKAGELSSATITCRATKTEGQGFFLLNSLPSGFTIQSFIDGEYSQTFSTATATISVSKSWQSVSFKLYNGSTLLDEETIPILNDGIDGLGPVVLDLDNEMASVVCDVNGNVTSGLPITINFSMYYGTEAMTIIGIANSFVSGVTISKNDSAGSSTISAITSSAPETIEITYIVRGEHKGMTYDRRTTFRVQKVASGGNGENAVLYQLLPSVNAVKVNKEGNYIDNSISCGLTKNDGGNVTEVSSVPSGYRMTVQKDSGSESSYTINSSMPSTSAGEKITFRLYTGDILADMETIPVIKDGTDGQDGEDGKDGAYTKLLYRWSNTKPETPEGVISPEYWSESPDNPADHRRFRSISGNFTLVDGWYRSPQTTSHGGTYTSRINFTTDADNVTIDIEVMISSEASDFGYVSRLDTAFSTISFSFKGSGQKTSMVSIPVPKAGSHFIEVAYVKDQGLSRYEDMFRYRIPRLINCWISQGRITPPSTSVTWSEPQIFPTDSKFEEFIYIRYKSEMTLSMPSSEPYMDEYIGEPEEFSSTKQYSKGNIVKYLGSTKVFTQSYIGSSPTSYLDGIEWWSDNPRGVTSTYKYEYRCVRRKSNLAWGSYGSFGIFSHWGKDGTDGEDGTDGISVMLSQDNIVHKKSEYVSAYTISISLIDKVAVAPSEYSIYIKSFPTGITPRISQNGTDGYKLTVGILPTATWNTTIPITLIITYGTYEITRLVYVSLIEDGADGGKGERGATLRGPQNWSEVSSGYHFYSGAAGEPYLDVVIYENNYYLCKKSHTKNARNYPTGGLDDTNGYWQLGDKIDLVATKVLLAQYGVIKNLGAEGITMKDKEGNVVFKAEKGSLICKVGTFENIDVSGIMHASLTYSSVKIFKEQTAGSSTYNIDPINEPANTYYIVAATGHTKFLNLPDANTYAGLELNFFQAVLTKAAMGDIYVAAASSQYIYYNTVGRLIAGNAVPVKLSPAARDSWIKISANEVIRLKAMNGAWFVMTGVITEE